MRRLSLSTLLIAVNVALVALAVICVVVPAVGLMRRLADEDGIARVRLAGVGAMQAVERSGSDAATAARLLGARPTLLRLVRQGDAAEASRFLEKFGAAGGLTGSAVLAGGAVFARGGADLPWSELASRAGAGGGGFLASGDGTAPLLSAAVAPLEEAPGTLVAVARTLDVSAVGSPAPGPGPRVEALGREEALVEAAGGTFPATPGQEFRVALRARAMETGTTLAERIREAALYVCVIPLRDAGGRVVGVVEARLPTGGADSSTRSLVRSLLAVTAVVVLLAMLSSVLVARLLARPLEALTEASVRIGRGDLATAIPRVPGAETGMLGAAMEEMRGRLMRLTAELHRRHDEAEAMLTGILEGVFAVDRERRVRYVNPQAAALLGIDPAAAVGRFCGDVLNPEAAGGARPCEDQCPILHARFRGSARATERLVLRDGGVRSVVITSSAPSGEEGGRQFQVMRDETELEATRRLRDAVIANISHEFRTPLSAQLASIEMLRDRLGEGDNPDVVALVLSLERGTLRLAQLIDNLLESVRIEGGQDSIRRRPVALDEVVQEAAALTGPLIEQRRQRLLVELPYPLPPVTGDATRLVQVFVNLLANANKFAPAGSAISVGGAVEGGEVVLWVEDEGPGLPVGRGSSVFDRFVRAPGRTDEDEPEQSGMGLGLWIVRSIVERHGGRVEARAAGGGAAEAGKPGTRICVILPGNGRDEDPGR